MLEFINIHYHIILKKIYKYEKNKILIFILIAFNIFLEKFNVTNINIIKLKI